MKHSISHIEAGSQNARLSSQFFSQLFGWQYTATEKEGEGYFQTPSCRIGHHGSDPTPALMVFFEVEDVEQSALQVASLGGKASEPTPPEPDFGRFCMCEDPQGIPFGLHQKQ